jgi:hypothetical protein
MPRPSKPPAANVREHGREGQIRVTDFNKASGDFFKDPLPKADLSTMGMILHDWNLEKKRHLIRAPSTTPCCSKARWLPSKRLFKTPGAKGEEFHVLLKGRKILDALGDKIFVTEGPSIVNIPAGVPHSFQNLDGEVAEPVVIFPSNVSE